jgi:hypothetical protein
MAGKKFPFFAPSKKGPSSQLSHKTGIIYKMPPTRNASPECFYEMGWEGMFLKECP